MALRYLSLCLVGGCLGGPLAFIKTRTQKTHQGGIQDLWQSNAGPVLCGHF